MATAGGGRVPVPILSVEIAGRRLSVAEKGFISEFTYEEREKTTAEATLVFVGADRDRVADVVPKKGDVLRARWGYIDDLVETVELVVHDVEPAYGEETKFTVKARDRGHTLGKRSSRKVYGAVIDAVQIIAKHHGLQVELPRRAEDHTKRGAQADEAAGIAQEAIMRQVIAGAQRGFSDRQLLEYMAQKTGCEVRIDGKTLRFLPKATMSRPRVRLRWLDGSGVLKSWNVRDGQGGKGANPARGTTAVAVDPLSGNVSTSTASDATLPGRPVVGKAATFGGPAGDGRTTPLKMSFIDTKKGGDIVRTEIVTREAEPGEILATPSGDPGTARQNARAAHDEAEGNAITASFEVVGIAGLRRGAIVELSGRIRREDAGNWIVSAVRHKIGDGFQVSGEARRHGQNAAGRGVAKTSGKPNEMKAPQDGAPKTRPIRMSYVNSRKGGDIVKRT